MAIGASNYLSFLKTWIKSEDFPTYQTSEAQVRADLQYHPDAVKTYINTVLIPAINAELASVSAGAVQDGTVTPSKLSTTLTAKVNAYVCDVTLPAAADWSSEKTYMIPAASIRAGLNSTVEENVPDDAVLVTADTDVCLDIQTGATATQVKNFVKARFVGVSQGAGAVTLKCLGVLPAATIPVRLTLREDAVKESEFSGS